jgi:hypothetical protein
MTPNARQILNVTSNPRRQKTTTPKTQKNQEEGHPQEQNHAKEDKYAFDIFYYFQL